MADIKMSETVNRDAVNSSYRFDNANKETSFERSEHKGQFHSSLLHCSHNNNAFTLAEVLITLGVIGVVAAVTMPMLITNINDRANSERHANIAYKMTQAMEQMRAHGKLTAYDSTSAFVDELQKYLKITKRCDADHIAECWPTETVTTASGEEYNVVDCKQRKNLLAGSDSEDENVGLILADGTSVILTYDPSAAPMDIGDKITASNKSLPVGKNKTKDFAYTTDVTRSIDFVTDVNGKKGPNSETRDNKYYDIRNFKLAQFTTPEAPAPSCDTGCVGECGSQGCVKLAATGSNWAPLNCDISSDLYAGNDICGPTPSGYSSDYWAGAKKLCADAGMQLPDESTLNDIYSDWVNSGEYQTEFTPTKSYYFWTSTEHSQYHAKNLNFFYSVSLYFNKFNDDNGSAVLCVN